VPSDQKQNGKNGVNNEYQKLMKSQKAVQTMCWWHCNINLNFQKINSKLQRINQIKRKDVQEPNEHIKGRKVLG